MHDRGPDQIKMFFDRQRPQHRVVRGHSEQSSEVREVEKAQANEWPAHSAVFEPSGSRQHNQEQQAEVERRQYPQGSANVEATVVVGLRLTIQQNSGDEKSREDEEKIYAGPAAQGCCYEKVGGALEL